jgi:hypothetical protein
LQLALRIPSLHRTKDKMNRNETSNYYSEHDQVRTAQTFLLPGHGAAASRIVALLVKASQSA